MWLCRFFFFIALSVKRNELLYNNNNIFININEANHGSTSSSNNVGEMNILKLYELALAHNVPFHKWYTHYRIHTYTHRTYTHLTQSATYTLRVYVGVCEVRYFFL